MTFGSVKYYLLQIVTAITVLVNAQNATFRPLTMDNGLSNFVVTSFYKDSVGFMWIGTDNSLDRFDGVDFKHYKFNTGDINKKRVRAITETLSGQLYIGNGVGLWKLNKFKNDPELIFPKEIDCVVTSLKWDSKDKKLYIGTEKGLFILDLNNNIQFVALDNNVLSLNNYITGITFDDESRIWMTTKKGLCSYNKVSKKISLYEYKILNVEQSFFARITRIGSTLYMGTSKTGLISFDINTFTFAKSVDVGSDIITDISSDGKENIYVATDGNGVHFISHASKRIVRSFRYEPRAKNGIRSNSIYSLLVDRNNNIWVGFYQAGLDYSLYQSLIFDVYSFPPYFDSNGLPVRAFLIRDKEKLIGTREGLYYINEQNNTVKSFTKDELRSNLVLSLIFHKGEYYIGTYGGGVSVLNPQTMKVRPLTNDFTLLKGHGFHFEVDALGQLWIATSGGLYRYVKEKNELFAYTNSNSQLYSGNVFYVFFDSSGKGWIATENGLCIYDAQSRSIKSNVFPSGFFNKEIIKVIHEDSKHKLFFCPDKGNIFVSDIDMRNFSLLETTKRFKERVFLSILEDKNRNYWLGSDNGLVSIRENDENYHSFGFADGIPDPVFSTDASYIDKNGKLWFGNAKGLLVIDANKLKNIRNVSFPVVITDFNVNGSIPDAKDKSDFNEKKKVNLDYSENNIHFKFVCLKFTNPSTIVYEYKLEGYDKDWQILTSGTNELYYSDLPPGEYTLRVRSEGNPISESQMEFEIHSFFSFTFWIVFLILALIVYFSANKLLHAYRLLKEKVSGMTNPVVSKIEEKYKYSKITEPECKSICEKLYAYIETEKPFSNPDLKIVDLAHALHCSSHTLSFIFNQYLAKNYYDFINEYRIKEFKRLVSGQESSKYTLSALAEQCGFSSRASFFRSFKKLTGITPNEYIRSIGKNLHVLEGEDE